MEARITKDDVIDFLKDGGKFVGAHLLKIYGKTLDQVGEQVFSEAIELGIQNTIAALYDAKVPDKIILRVVSDHWGISSECVGKRLVWEKQRAPVRAIRQYLKLQGYSSLEIDSFLQEKIDLLKLRHSNDLWKLKDDPEKLIKAIKR